MTKEQREEKLKDRRAYREALIERRNGIDQKLAVVEKQIGDLKAE